MKNLNLDPSSGQVAIRILKKNLCLLKVPGLLLLITWTGACHHSAEDHHKNDRELRIRIEPILIPQLGAEHLGNIKRGTFLLIDLQ
ncbi:MAG: hypothetical protein KFF73_19340 [Cyclobacteriaceae bacterium]|nr:hypothetical protein [Cyclobacteriaceae bacterium]